MQNPLPDKSLSLPVLLPACLIIGLAAVLLCLDPEPAWRTYAWLALAGAAAGWGGFSAWLLQQNRRAKAGLMAQIDAVRSRSQAVLDAAADGVISANGNKIIQSFNPGAESLFGYQASEVIGKPVESLFAEVWRLPANSFLDMLLQKKQERQTLKPGETLALHKDGHEFPLFLSCSMVRAAGEATLFLLARDITARKKAEQRVNRSAASQKVLNQLLRLSLSSGDLDKLLSQALNAVFAFPWLSSMDKGAILLNGSDGQGGLRVAAQYGLEDEALAEIMKPGWLMDYCGAKADQSGLEVCALLDEQYAITYCARPPEGYYNLPILSGGRCLGVLVLVVVQGSHGQVAQVDFLESVSHTLAGLIEMRLAADALKKSEADLRAKQQHLDEDLRVAADIQHTFLPKSMPELKEVDLDWKFVPNQHIGGDIFNAYMLDEHNLLVYIVDVSGHGVPSGLVTVSVHEMLAMHSGHVSRRNAGGALTPVAPSQILKMLDDEYPVERFDKTFSIVYLLMDVRSGKLTYASAGHPPPMLLKASGELQLLDSTATIIGMSGFMPIYESELQLSPGDKLVLYTDGVIEYENPAGGFYGIKRFKELLAKHRQRPMPDIIEETWASMMQFGSDASPQDDVSLLGLTYNGSRNSQEENLGAA